MQLTNDEAERLIRDGVDQLRQGRAGATRERFEQVTATGRANAQVWLLLATACRMADDNAGTEAAVDQLLRAGARINPHTGTTNTRLVCHLPLIVPPGCRFRVGNEVREWEEGKLLIFDDSIEHEAWNDGREDRTILIFDIWRPELSDQEKREIDVLFSGPTISA